MPAGTPIGTALCAGTPGWNPAGTPLPAYPSNGPFQRWNSFEHLFGTLPADPSSAGTLSSTPSRDLSTTPPLQTPVLPKALAPPHCRLIPVGKGTGTPLGAHGWPPQLKPRLDQDKRVMGACKIPSKYLGGKGVHGVLHHCHPIHLAFAHHHQAARLPGNDTEFAWGRGLQLLLLMDKWAQGTIFGGARLGGRIDHRTAKISASSALGTCMKSSIVHNSFFKYERFIYEPRIMNSF